MTELTDHQGNAVKLAKNWFAEVSGGEWNDAYYIDQYGEHKRELGEGQAFILGGYAGTGKSTILPFLIDDMGLSTSEVAFCAPTGKAAKVMGTKLKDFGIFTQPTTIHKLIYKPRSEKAEEIERLISSHESKVRIMEMDGLDTMVVYDEHGKPADWTRNDFAKDINRLRRELASEMANTSGPSFTLRNPDELPDNIKLIIVDEASMVGRDIADDLASFNRPILAMGDPGQLPPVQDSAGFSMDHADVFLTEIHRQAADNPIIHLATMARNGEDIPLGDYGNGVKVILRRNDKYTYDLDRDAMVITGTHKKRWMLTSNIRKGLGINQTGPAVDEPLMICRNSKTYPGLVNGTIVRNLRDMGDLIDGKAVINMHVIEDETNTEFRFNATQCILEEHLFRERNSYSAEPQAAFRSKRNNEHVDFAHVITGHKSQGSQWSEVIVHDESSVFRDNASKWLYTAITRAAERLILIQ